MINMTAFLLSIIFCFIVQQSTAWTAVEASSKVAANEKLLRIVKRDAFIDSRIVWDDEQYYQIVEHSDSARYNQATQDFNHAFDLPNVVKKNISSWHNSTKVQLKFLFYFYGHSVSRIAVSTNGFITIWEDGHEPGPFPQYIAPFLANVGPPGSIKSVDNKTDYDAPEEETIASVAYVSTNTSVWVRWSDLPLMLDNGTELRLSFQCAIFQNGSMLFQYYNIPPDLSKTVPSAKAGVADVFNYDTGEKSLDEEIHDIFIHRAENVSLANIKNNSMVQITPLPTCGQKKRCSQCMTTSLSPTFSCSWCFQRGQCVTDKQRKLLPWLDLECHYPSDSKCQLDKSPKDGTDGANILVRGILGFFLALFLATLVGLIIFVFVYGYRRPDSSIGQCLLRTRMQLRDKIMGARRIPSAFYNSSASRVRLE